MKPLIYSLFQRICRFGSSAWYWGMVCAVCVALEIGALVYQHGLGYLPCELCIYIRVWIALLASVSLLGVIAHPWLLPRLAVTGLALGVTIGLLKDTWQLLGIENGWTEGGSCGFFAKFPTWAPLDSWLPQVFEVQEFCQSTPIILYRISMADVLAFVAVSFVTSLVCLCVCTLNRILRGASS